MISEAKNSKSGLPANTPTSSSAFVTSVLRSLLAALEEQCRRRESDSTHRRAFVETSSDHHMYNAGVPEANERLRAGCKHLYMSNNLCPLYLMVRGAVVATDGGQDMRDLEVLLDQRLRVEAAKFVDTVLEASGVPVEL